MGMTRKKTIGVVVLLLLITASVIGLYTWKHSQKSVNTTGSQQAEQYTCPMHPFIIKDKPGACPICNMSLVKKVEGETASSDELEKLSQISLSATQMVMANVKTQAVTVKPLVKEVVATGIVAYDQTRQAKVTAWVAGRIDRLFVAAVGDQVSKNRPVAELYSPELVSAQQEYLLALKSRNQLKNSALPAISQGGEGLVASARQRLLLMGVKEQQIVALEKSGEPNIKLPVYTPLSGVVVEKIAIEGQYVNVGEPLFVIVDLSSVWVEAELYESDLSSVRVGQSIEVTAPAWPGRTFHGRIAFVYPFLDPKTRTLKVRIQLGNPGLILKPDMFVNVVVKQHLGSSIVIPSTAVMDTGKRQVVWVQVKEGVFEPRDVQVGPRVGDEVQIIKGLESGEIIAGSGTYLIDSESQLRGGAASGHEGHGTQNTIGADKGLDMGTMEMENEHKGHAPAKPTKNKKNDMNMDDMKM